MAIDVKKLSELTKDYAYKKHGRVRPKTTGLPRQTTPKRCACGNSANYKHAVCSTCMSDAKRQFSDIMKHYDAGRFIKWAITSSTSITGVCTVCGCNYTFNSDNPDPIIDNEDAHCCNICHDLFIDTAPHGSK